MNNKKYTTSAKLMADLLGDPGIESEVKEKLARRKKLDALVAERAKAGLTIRDVAKRMRITIEPSEEDAESLVRHRNRTGLTSAEKDDTMSPEKSFKEVGKALRKEKTVQNPAERNTRLRPQGLGRQASSTRQSSGEQSTRQATASSARLQLTQKQVLEIEECWEDRDLRDFPKVRKAYVAAIRQKGGAK